jgi:hypothetical protein
MPFVKVGEENGQSIELFTGAPTKVGFDELLRRLRKTGEFAWVRQVTMGFWDEERGAPLDLRFPTPAPLFDSTPG